MYSLRAPNAVTIAQLDSQSKVKYLSRVAVPVETIFNSDQNGVWQTLPNGDRLWLLSLECAKAKGLYFYYNKFWLPPGGKLWLYRPDTTQIMGAFTSVNNSGSREQPGDFITGIITGEKTVFEYYQPAGTTRLPVISISQVMYCYKNLLDKAEPDGDFGNSLECEIDVACGLTETESATQLKNSVALVLFHDGLTASGFLINNVNADGTPFFLMANDIIAAEGLDACACDGSSTGGNPGTNVSTKTDVQFYWGYESSTCGPSTEPSSLSYSLGATVRANMNIIPGSSPPVTLDFALLQLSEAPPSNAFFAGWNNTGNIATPSTPIQITTIGHPEGDVKKIAASDAISSLVPVATTSSTAIGSLTIGEGFWMCGIDNGIVENGYSGAPGFNESSQAIGQFVLNEAGTCSGTTVSTQSIAFFGRMDLEWTPLTSLGAEDFRQLKPWLDPSSTGATTLGGGILQPCIPQIAAEALPITSSLTVNAGITLTASSVISIGTTVVYTAGETVMLEPGFQADNFFDAFIQTCLNVNDALVGPHSGNISQTAFATNSQTFVVFPNPTPNEFTIQYSLPEDAAETLQLINMQGQAIQTFYQDKLLNAGMIEHNLNLNASLAQGVYFLRLSSNQSMIVQKVIKID